MKQDDVKILESSQGYTVTIKGRANFDYAVPLRELAKTMTGEETVEMEMQYCEAMDSTFMGVLTMIGMKLRKNGRKVKLLHTSEFLQKLLSDLGVSKIFEFGECVSDVDPGVRRNFLNDGSRLKRAETVVEAHQTLIAADNANAAKFANVIKYAELDVQHLQSEAGKSESDADK